MKKYFFSLLLSALAAALPHQLIGQCTNCVGSDPNNPLEVALDQFCELTLVGSFLLTDETTCEGQKELVLQTLSGTEIYSALDVALVDLSSYINDTLRVIMQDVTTGQSCTSYLNIKDQLAPTLECVNRTIDCLADTSATFLGFPSVGDECATPLIFSYLDSITDFPCENQLAGIITRTWTVSDASGNESSCEQFIQLNRRTLTEANINFPSDITIGCEDNPDDLSLTGKPVLNSLEIDSRGICDIEVEYGDVIVPTNNPPGLTITRTWTITNNCDQTTLIGTQTILTRDMEAPSILCPNDTVFGTNTGMCGAEILLPTPIMTDNCDPMVSYEVETPVGIGPGTLFFPVGMSQLTYIAVDASGNESECSTNITVFDAETPVANCDPSMQIVLSGAVLTPVEAITFDEGSRDNCSDLFFKVKRMEPGSCMNAAGDDSVFPGYQEWFDDLIYFCCEDYIEDSIQVVLRVYDIHPGEGAVNPDRESNQGDLDGHYADCMISVTVQSEEPPAISCPPNVSIDCKDDYSDLSVFGTVDTMLNCIVSLDSIETININGCGTGFITREFVATDIAGNEGSCMQTIAVVNETPFDEDNIIWPLDLVLTGCGVETHPDSLPDTFNRPVIGDESCSMIMTHYADDVYKNTFPACYKIKRTWSVIDWCTYNPDTPAPDGIFRQIQTIEINDEEAPVVVCPRDTIIGIQEDCDLAEFIFDSLFIDDCSPQIAISHNSVYAYESSGIANGRYPLGSTSVTHIIADNCGNTTVCESTITVVDNKAPSMMCMNGLTIPLVEMNGEFMATLYPDDINVKSFDNCTSQDDLKLRIRVWEGNSSIPPVDSVLTFDCFSRGPQLIELWGIDEVGNSDYCAAYVNIQDNKGFCPASVQTTGSIVGSITTEWGAPIKNTMVEVSMDLPMSVATNETGNFQLNELPFGMPYTLAPRKEDDIVAGVSTIDLLIITKHILGLTPIQSPYKLIAADVDQSGAISTLDLIKLRRIILGVDHTLPNNRSPWCFVDASFDFSAYENPLEVDLPETISISSLNRSLMYADFIGIKIGDVNESVQVNGVVSVQPRSSSKAVEVYAGQREALQNEEFQIQLKLPAKQEFAGIQFALEWDVTKLQLTGFLPGNLKGMDLTNFGLQDIEEGRLALSWNERNGQAIQATNPFLTILNFKAKEGVILSDVIRFKETTLASELIINEKESIPLVLNFGAYPEDLAWTSRVDNYPNPFTQSTTIRAEIPEDHEVTLEIMDAQGRLIKTVQEFRFKGLQHFQLDGEAFEHHYGLLYYRISAGNFLHTGKMIRIR
ncbi:MAG: hypothetical protein RLZZ248_1063 [Bacteroidota bacterium]